MKQEMTGWQCHQLDHVQIICTSLQTALCHSLGREMTTGPEALPVLYGCMICWLRGPAVEHRSLADVLSLSYARLVPDG